MSADHSTKYSVDNQMNILSDGTGVTDHARHRYRERTPHYCDVPIAVAYSRSERIPHPSLIRTHRHYQVPERALIYHHRGHEWNIIFLINTVGAEVSDVDEVLSTCLTVDGYEHGPTRAYLNSFGPHTPGGADQ